VNVQELKRRYYEQKRREQLTKEVAQVQDAKNTFSL
jgi:hypothetical protein